jgi:integrase
MSERLLSVSPAYWKAGHKCYYCNVTYESGRREQRRLDPDPKEADKKRGAIVSGVEVKQPPWRDMPVRKLLDAFLTWDEANSSKKTYKWHRGFLRSFSTSVSPKLTVNELKLSHVEKWLTKHYPRTANPNTRRAAVVCVKRAFNWAVKQMEYLDRSPLGKLARPPQRHRGTCLSHDQWSKVLAEVGEGDPFYDFLMVLLETGTRPQQARIIEGRHVNFDALVVHFEDGEVPGKRGSQDFPLTERAATLLRRLALKQSTGPLLRNCDGNPWTPSAINSRCQRLKGKLPFRAFCYAARHTYAMDLIEAGASAGMVSTALGHRDKTVVLKVYGNHFDQRDKRLRECVEAAADQREASRKRSLKCS